MAGKVIKGKDFRIVIDGVRLPDRPVRSMPIEGFSGTFVVKPGNEAKFREALRIVCQNAPRAKAALTCLHCGTAEDFKGHPSIKEAMIQIDDFSRAHSGCAERRENDEREATRGSL